MGDQQSEPVPADVPACVQKRVADPPERHLEQHPARAARTVGDDVEVVATEAGRAVGMDLAAGMEPQLDARGVDRGLQRPRACRDRGHVEVEVGMADVRRDRRVVDPGARDPLGVSEAGALVGRTVVDAGQEVEMQIDVCHHR